MRKKAILGFDLDGVIIDHYKNKIFVLKRLGFSFRKKDLATDILGKKMPIELWKKAQGLLYDHPKISMKPDVFEGALDALKLLEVRGSRYFLVSRRRDAKMAIKLLRKRKLWPRFFNSRNAFFVRKVEGKNKKTADLGISHYIDDQPSVLKGLGSVKNLFLFDPHNSFGRSRRYKKISSWKEFSSELDVMI